MLHNGILLNNEKALLIHTTIHDFQIHFIWGWAKKSHLLGDSILGHSGNVQTIDNLNPTMDDSY